MNIEQTECKYLMHLNMMIRLLMPS